nr:hypothetical protein [Tanacetum cinerariifolium]
MRIEQYLTHADYALWEVIVNGDAPAAIASVSGGAETLWEAIKTRFRGDKESKKIQKTILKQQHKNFAASRSEGLDKTYDRFQKLTRQLEIHDLDTLSMDDLYNNLKVFEAEIKGQSSSNSNSQNVAFVSSDNTSSTNEAVNIAHDVSTASSQGQDFASTYADDVMFSFFANQSNSLQLDNKYLEHIDTDDLEEMDLKWQVAMLTMRVKRFIKKTGRNLNFNGKEIVGFDKTKVECYNCHRRGHFARECRAPKSQGNRNRDNTRRIVPVETPAKTLVVTDRMGYDWSYQAEEGPTDFDLMVFSSSGSSSSDTETGLGYDSHLNEKDLNNKSDVFESASDSSVNESEEDNSQANDRYKAGKEYHAVPPSYTGNFMPPRPDLSFAGLDDSVFKIAISETVTSVNETKTSASKTSKESMEKPKTVRPSAPIIEDWESGSDDDCEIRLSIEQNKPSHAKINFVKSDENTRNSVIEQHTYRQAKNLRKSQNSKDYNFYENKMVKKYVLNNEGKATGQREVRPVWNNAKRVNHQKFYNNLTHPHPRRNFVPRAVITNTGKVPVNTAKQSSPRAATSTNTARYVNTAATRPTVNGAKPSSNIFHKSHSPVRRTFNQRTSPKNSVLKEKINTAKVNNVTTAETKAVVSAVQGNRENVVKHMMGNMSFLTDYQEIDGGFVAFGESPKGGKIFGKGKIRTGKLDFEDVYFVKELKFNFFSVSQICDKKNSVLFTETECLVLSPDFKLLDENQVLLKNIVLVTKPHNKTPYELLIGRSPNLDFMKPFRCHVTILYTLDHLDKFEGKADEGFLVGYSVNRRGPEWLFNIDSLTKSMNYESVIAGNQTDNDAVLRAQMIRILMRHQTKEMKVLVNEVELMIEKGLIAALKIMPSLEKTGIFDDVFNDREVGAEADINNLDLSTVVSPIPTIRVHKDHPKEQIIGDLNLATQTRRMINFSEENAMVGFINKQRRTNHKDYQHCLFAYFLSQQEPKKVWTLVDLPNGKRAIGTKWVFRNKKDERGIVVRNKARLVVQGYTQVEGIDCRMQLSELMEICSLEQIKTNQAAEIEKLKKRVKKLEGKKKRTHRLKRLYKVGLTVRVESSEEEEDPRKMNDEDLFGVNNLDGDEVIMDVTAGENVKQDATVVEKDFSAAADEVVTTAKSVEGITAATTPRISKDDVILTQTLIEIKAVKPRARGVIV